MERMAHSILMSIMAMGLVLAQGAPLAEEPYSKPVDSWVSLSGTVVGTSENTFLLDYGEGLINVEMDGWDWQKERAVLEEDYVIVSGRVDTNLFDTRTIDASVVYVDDINTYFYLDPMQERIEPVISYTIVSLQEGARLSVTGTVEEIQRREFILNANGTSIKVDTIAMDYNPLDDQGYQQIDVGDQVNVAGEMDIDFFERREIMADTIVSMNLRARD